MIAGRSMLMSQAEPLQAAIERLYEDEALRDNLTDDVAQPLLAWAEQQITAGVAPDRVVAALRAANRSATETAEAALLIAKNTLNNAATPGAAAPLAAQPAPPPQAAPPSRWVRFRQWIANTTRSKH